MPPFDNPTVLITRPCAASQRFAQALAQAAGPFVPVICPAFELVASAPVPPDFEAAVFTSRAGVEFAPKGAGRTAFCVGDATAKVARDAGYKPISAAGSAGDLCALILGQAPQAALLHIRGESSTGDVRTTLINGGLHCAEVVAYRKQITAPDLDVLEAIQGAQNVIIPLFSLETVSIMADWSMLFDRFHVVAISAAVADGAADLAPASVCFSARPDLPSIVAQTGRLIA